MDRKKIRNPVQVSNATAPTRLWEERPAPILAQAGNQASGDGCDATCVQEGWNMNMCNATGSAVCIQ